MSFAPSSGLAGRRLLTPSSSQVQAGPSSSLLARRNPERRNHRCEPRSRNNAPTPRIVPFAPSTDFIVIDQICRAAE